MASSNSAWNLCEKEDYIERGCALIVPQFPAVLEIIFISMLARTLLITCHATNALVADRDDSTILSSALDINWTILRFPINEFTATAGWTVLLWKVSSEWSSIRNSEQCCKSLGPSIQLWSNILCPPICDNLEAHFLFSALKITFGWN
jgi:hypothetical protein